MKQFDCVGCLACNEGTKVHTSASRRYASRGIDSSMRADLRATASAHACSRRFFPPFLSILPSLSCPSPALPCPALPCPFLSCASPAPFAPSLTVCLSSYCIHISRSILSRTFARARLSCILLRGEGFDGSLMLMIRLG